MSNYLYSGINSRA